MAQNIQAMLDSITDEPGSILFRAEDGWHGLNPPPTDNVLVYDIDSKRPMWVEPTPNGITELTGDVLAGPASGTTAATLATTGVTPGSYSLATITVDGKGRITSAANGTAPPSTPTELLPGWVPGRYYAPGAPQTSATVIANRLYYTPMIVPTSGTITRTGIFVTSAIAASGATIGVYANNNGQPGSLIAVLGNVSTATALARTITGLSVAFSNQFLWTAVVFSHASGVQTLAGATIPIAEYLGYTAPTNTSLSPTGYFEAFTYSTTNLPLAAGALSELTSTAPCVWIGA